MVKKTSLIEVSKKRYFSKLFTLESGEFDKVLELARKTFKTRNTKQFLKNFKNLYKNLTHDDQGEDPKGIYSENIEEGRNLQIRFEQLPKDIILVHLAKQLWRNPKNQGNQETRFTVEIFHKREEKEEWEKKNATRIIVMEENALVSDQLGVMSL